MDNKLLYLCQGASLCFFALCSAYFLCLKEKKEKRLQHILGYVMLLWFAESVKDLAFLFPEIAGNSYLFNALQLLDIISVAPCVFIAYELIRPGWSTWSKLWKYESVFLLFFFAFIIVGAIEGMGIWTKYILWASMAYSVAFSIYIIVLLFIEAKKFNRQLRDTYSYVENIDIHWMKWVLIIFFFFVLIWSYSVICCCVWTNILYYLVSIAFWACIAYFINRQQAAVELAYSNEAVKESNNDSNIDIDEQKLLDKWNKLMTEEHLFLNAHLTLQDVALAMGTNRGRLSKFVNHHFGMSFLDYVNALRIEYAVPLLHEPEAKVSAVCEISGFCSQNTFYRYFKNRFGCTPGEYIYNINSKYNT